MSRLAIGVLALSVAVGAAGCSLIGLGPTTESTAFVLRIQNVSTADTLVTSAGSHLAAPLSPGLWAVHSDPNPLFKAGKPDRGDGLEALAEDGNPATLTTNLSHQAGIRAVGVFDTPIGADSPGVLGPGAVYEARFSAKPGMRLSLATMFVQSNDLFYAPDGAGLRLFDPDGRAIDGDVTYRIRLWDAGTEQNEEPGLGPHQPPRQSGPNMGLVEHGIVGPVNDGYRYPGVNEVLRVTLTPAE